jgi:hypothetical protein
VERIAFGHAGNVASMRAPDGRRAVSLALAASVLAGCGGSDAVDMSGYRRPGAPPTYWLGRAFEGLPLTEVTEPDAPTPTFVYGTCEPSSDSGCAPPLELQHWRLADRRPDKFTIAPGEPTPCQLVGDGRITAARFPTTGGVELYLGDRVVVVFSRDELVPKVMRQLRPVKAQSPALPRPPAWVARQLERCRR